MICRSCWLMIALVMTFFLLCASPGLAQGERPAASDYRTAWGAPDLQGVWDFRTITPLERPPELAGKEFLTAKEAAEFEKATVAVRHKDERGGGAEADVRRAYNHFWWDYGTNAVETRRTSLIVDPPDGQIPALTEAGEERSAEMRERRVRADNPEEIGTAARCVVGFNAGPPMNPAAYNNNVRILQTEDHVVIHNEMVHDARVVPLDGRPVLPEDYRQLSGESRGHWEGNTLVVETGGFTDRTSFRGSGPSMYLTERFTRTAEDGLLYEYTIDDSESFTRPWSVEVPMRRQTEPMYEYACHESNYGMRGILAGARFLEKQSAQ